MKNNDYVTKNYLEKTLDKAFAKNNKILLEAISSGFEEAKSERNRIETKFDRKFNQIMTNMNSFLKRSLDFEDEFTIIKAEVSKIKKVFKEKFGISISLMD
jgi:uncharacterized protein YllA (UPF0747 family)